MNEQTNIGKRLGPFSVLEYLTTDELGFSALYRARCVVCGGKVVLQIYLDGGWIAQPHGCRRKQEREQNTALLLACI